MISTKNLDSLPSISNLNKLCKSLSVLDAIISPEWFYRYYSYQKNWSKTESFFEMRDGSGNEMKILFSSVGCVINGFAHESEMNNWEEVETKEEKSLLKKIFGTNKKKFELVQNISKGVVDNLPNEFHEFIFGEPVKSSGTTFCIWRKSNESNWSIGPVEFPNNNYLDGSSELLNIFDNNPNTYKSWAEEYFEDEFENRKLDIDSVKHIYNGNLITKDLVLKINPEINDLEQLITSLNDIGYEHNLG